jgi:hypothetical protein
MATNERHEVEIEGYMMLHRFLSRSICLDLCSNYFDVVKILRTKSKVGGGG